MEATDKTKGKVSGSRGGGFEVKFEHVPSRDVEERLLRAFEMIFFKDGELAPEFKEKCLVVPAKKEEAKDEHDPLE